MCVVLAVFFNYHVTLAVNNQTTNESFKKWDCEYDLNREKRILNKLISECEEWDPS
jgi:hypothetical protein